MTSATSQDSALAAGHRRWIRNMSGSNAPVDLQMVEDAERLIDMSGVLKLIVSWRSEDRAGTHPGGAKVTVTDRACLVILLILATESSPLHVKKMAQMIARRLTPEALRHLGLTRPGTLEQWYDRVGEAHHRILGVVDPYPGQRRERPTEQELKEILDTRDPVKMARKKERLDELSAALLHATYLSIPREYRRKWKGNTCIDATFISAFGKRGTRKDKSHIGIEYDAGWYFRDGNHSAADAAKGDKGRFGWEIHLVTMVANAYRVEAEFPLLILGASTDKPAGRIAENALTAYTHMKAQFDDRRDDALPGGYAMGDRAYFAGTKANSLQIPLRQMGFGLLMDFKSDQLGTQTADISGAIQVDGSWYCPDMAQPLIDATADYRAGRIDREIHQARMKERARYLAVRKAGPDPSGYTRWSHPTVENGHVCDGARPGAPRFCTQKSVTISPISGAKFGQDLPHESFDWKQLYNTGRNTIEGWNAVLKDHGGVQIDSSGRRRVRGRTAAHFAVILLIVAANLEKVGKFLDLQDDKLRAAAVQARKSRRPGRIWDWSKNMRVDVPASASSSASVRC